MESTSDISSFTSEEMKEIMKMINPTKKQVVDVKEVKQEEV